MTLPRLSSGNGLSGPSKFQRFLICTYHSRIKLKKRRANFIYSFFDFSSKELYFRIIEISSYLHRVGTISHDFKKQQRRFDKIESPKFAFFSQKFSLNQVNFRLCVTFWSQSLIARIENDQVLAKMKRKILENQKLILKIQEPNLGISLNKAVTTKHFQLLKTITITFVLKQETQLFEHSLYLKTTYEMKYCGKLHDLFQLKKGEWISPKMWSEWN